MSYEQKDAELDFAQQVREAVENDNYGALRMLAQDMMQNGEEEEAERIMQLGYVAYENAWGFDIQRDNAI